MLHVHWARRYTASKQPAAGKALKPLPQAAVAHIAGHIAGQIAAGEQQGHTRQRALAVASLRGHSALGEPGKAADGPGTLDGAVASASG